MTRRSVAHRNATARPTSDRTDVHAAITAAVIEAIERGETTTGMPWAGATSLPIKASDGTPYRGLNVLHLWAVASLRGYASPVWGGFGTWRARGGHVRRGERGTRVVYAGPIDEPASTENGRKSDGSAGTTNGTAGDRPRRFARSFTVFNRDQVDGLAEEKATAIEPRDPHEHDAGAVERIDGFAAALGARVHRRGARAFYDRCTDEVTVPPLERFVGTATQTPGTGYASTLAHELVHWSGRVGRAAREIEPGRVGYAREELVAELGAAYLAPELGFAHCGVADHAGYVAGWLELLRSDTFAIAHASRDASSAASWLLERSSGAVVLAPDVASA